VRVLVITPTYQLESPSMLDPRIPSGTMQFPAGMRERGRARMIVDRAVRFSGANTDTRNKFPSSTFARMTPLTQEA
jgi:hypothetical protein